jgi:hypothetical protein
VPAHRDAVRAMHDRGVLIGAAKSPEGEHRDSRPLYRRRESCPSERTRIGMRRRREHRAHDGEVDIERARMRELRARMTRCANEKVVRP